MTDANNELDLLIVGGGPCGVAAAISAQRAGLRVLVIEAQTVVSTIAHYPTYVRFFSTAEKLSLGDVPFVVATEKPSRRDALAYYRAVVKHFNIPLRQYERVTSIDRNADGFVVRSTLRNGIERDTVVITGPNGEEQLPATFVYVMTGFAPQLDLLRELNVPIDPQTGIPKHDPATLETSVPGIFIAGVVIAGYDANKVFIENG